MINFELMAPVTVKFSSCNQVIFGAITLTGIGQNLNLFYSSVLQHFWFDKLGNKSGWFIIQMKLELHYACTSAARQEFYVYFSLIAGIYEPPFLVLFWWTYSGCEDCLLSGVCSLQVKQGTVYTCTSFLQYML